MKATKLIINGEEQELSQVYSVNGETGNIETYKNCELSITSVTNHVGTINIINGTLTNGSIIEGEDTVYNANIYKFSYNGDEIPLVAYLNYSDGSHFSGIYFNGKIYIWKQYSTAI